MRLTRGRRAAICTIAAAILYLAGLGRPALWEPDEGRYAEVAREMLVSGDYITPRNDWVRYFEKPPLVYWITAASLKVLGVNEFAARVQAAVFSAGQVGIAAALGEAMFGITTGILAAAALALSPLFFVFARFATPDPALAFFFTSALTCFYAAALAPSFNQGTGRHWMLGASAALALGTLAKGPVALLLAGAIALVWLIVERRSRDAIRMPWLSCAAVYLAIVLPWFIIAAYRNHGFLTFFVVHEHLHRYLSNEEHGWGLWFFIPVVIGGTWPWFYFIPYSIRDYFTPADEKPASDPRMRSNLRFLLLWFGIVFIFFSIPRAKLGEYILPGVPPLAIIAGVGLAKLVRARERFGRSLLWLLILNAVISAAAACAAFLLKTHLMQSLRLDAILGAAALILGSAIALLALRLERPLLAPGAIALGSVLMMGALVKARSDAASFYSYRQLTDSVRPSLSPECVLASYHHQIQALPFYTGHREVLVGYKGELAPFGDSRDAAATFIATDRQLAALWTSAACVILIANRGDLPHLQSFLHPPIAIDGCEGKKFALTNRAAGSDEVQASACGELIPESRADAIHHH
jgi:4-amino-4-deoxy-L-arabinose transferase-like glycosyltransferase